jgi:hypothetical protein
MIAFNSRLPAMNPFTNAELAERVDLIMSHVIDGEATQGEWNEFEALADAEPRLWRELARSQRDAGAVHRALAAAGAVADRVAMPVVTPVMAHPAQPPSHLRLNRAGAWTGWAAAAIITIIAAVEYRTLHSGSGGQQSGIGSTVVNGDAVRNAADAWNNYLTLGKEDGTVLGEMPGRMLVETRPVPQGEGFEVIFIRQVMERRVVPDLYEVTGLDDTGQPTVAPVRPAVHRTM